MASHTAVFNPHKKLKEEFVSNLEGTSLLEIAALSAIVPVVILLRQWDAFKFNCDQRGSSKIEMETYVNPSIEQKGWRNYVSSLIADIFFIVTPILSCLTILGDWTYICTICFLVLVLFRIFSTRMWSHSSISTNTQTIAVPYWRKSLSSYRFAMMLVTCLSILAVDFTIFPRRYAKTETYGTGLMDLGVGSFVLANALVSKQARNIATMKYQGALKSTSPLLLLGFIRLALMKGVDYQVHVGEYGVHWNFFFTLAAVAVLTSVISIHPQNCGCLGLFILFVYQAILLCGLNDYLLSAQRGANVFNQNKEGIFSLFGYWGLYLLGVNLGHYLFFQEKLSGTTIARRREQWGIAIEVWLLDGLFWALTIFLDQFVERISRRMCNLAYVAFILAQNFEVLGIVMLVDLVPIRARLVLEEVIDQNMLATFLLANVLTGLTNISIDTIFVSAFQAYCILLAYVVLLVLGIAIAKFNGIRLKFW